jgi:hypothetical protein
VGWQIKAVAPHGTALRAFVLLNDSVSMCPLRNDAIVP